MGMRVQEPHPETHLNGAGGDVNNGVQIEAAHIYALQPPYAAQAAAGHHKVGHAGQELGVLARQRRQLLH